VNCSISGERAINDRLSHTVGGRVVLKPRAMCV
jgi:hypothetical protein